MEYGRDGVHTFGTPSRRVKLSIFAIRADRVSDEPAGGESKLVVSALLRGPSELGIDP